VAVETADKVASRHCLRWGCFAGYYPNPHITRENENKPVRKIAYILA